MQSSKPLYEQLEAEKEKKEAEYDAVTKAMFAPPQVKHCVPALKPTKTRWVLCTNQLVINIDYILFGPQALDEEDAEFINEAARTAKLRLAMVKASLF